MQLCVPLLLPTQVLVPQAHPGQFEGGLAPKERWEHQPEDFAQQLRLGLQFPLDLLHQGLGQSQLLKCLFEGLQVSLRPSLFALEVLTCFLETTLLSVLLSFLPGLLQTLVVVFDLGHGRLLRVVAAPCLSSGGDDDPFCYVLSRTFMDTCPLARMDDGFWRGAEQSAFFNRVQTTGLLPPLVRVATRLWFKL
jgi:hypothetical protein